MGRVVAAIVIALLAASCVHGEASAGPEWWAGRDEIQVVPAAYAPEPVFLPGDSGSRVAADVPAAERDVLEGAVRERAAGVELQHELAAAILAGPRPPTVRVVTAAASPARRGARPDVWTVVRDGRRAALAVAVEAEGLSGAVDPDSPVVAVLHVRARVITGSDSRQDALFSWTLADPRPRTAAEWQAGGGRLYRETVARLARHAGVRIAFELLASRRDVAPGLAPGSVVAVAARRAPAGEPGRDELLRWEALAAGAAARGLAVVPRAGAVPAALELGSGRRRRVRGGTGSLAGEQGGCPAGFLGAPPLFGIPCAIAGAAAPSAAWLTLGGAAPSGGPTPPQARDALARMLGAVAAPRLAERLAGAVREACPACAPGAAARLELAVDSVALEGTEWGDPAVTLVVETSARIATGDAGGAVLRLLLVGPGPLPASTWLDDDGALLRGALDAQLERAARRIAADLHPAPP